MKHQLERPILVCQLILFFIGATLANTPKGSPPGFISSCGNGREVAARIGSCTGPMFEIALGRIEMPKNDSDLMALSHRFINVEKCIRGTARECLSGVHKAATSSVATSSRRFRTGEWKNSELRSKYYEPCACSIKLSKQLEALYQNETGTVQAIRDSKSLKAEEKLMRACCIFIELDNRLMDLYNAECPNSTDKVIKLIHALTDDARGTVCVSPKCQDTLKPFRNAKYKPPQQFIEPIMEILFGLNTGPDVE